MLKTVFQRYKSATGEEFVFELTEDGIIYLYDKSKKSRSQLNEGDRAAVERGLMVIGDWESDSAAYRKTLDSFLKELKKSKAELHQAPKAAKKKKR